MIFFIQLGLTVKCVRNFGGTLCCKLAHGVMGHFFSYVLGTNKISLHVCYITKKFVKFGIKLFSMDFLCILDVKINEAAKSSRTIVQT